jgi:hypothetical protein
MTDNNVPVDSVMSLMFPGHRPASFVAAAPLTVIAPAGSNNTATVAFFAVAITTGTAAAAPGVGAATLAATGADTLAAMPVANAAPTHVPTTAVSDATLVAMTAPSETETVVMSGGALSKGALSSSGIANAAQTEALSENELVAMAAASETALASAVLPSTYCLNKEDFVASLLSGDKTGVASSAGTLDEVTPPDALAEQDMELHYYRSHEASFNRQNPPGEVTAKNTKFKPKIQIDPIRNAVHTWHDYADRAKDQTLSEQEEKAFTLFKRANKAGNKWIKQYKTFELNVNGTMKVILCCMESKKDENGEEKLELGREVISQEEVFDAINDIYPSTGHMGMERTHTHCADKCISITQDMVRKYCRTCHVCIEANPVIAPHRGAKKPIYSDNWRNRFQVDLVDYRKMPHPNIYGQIQRWFMAVKDHSTGFTALFSLPRKKPMYVAFELERYFGLAGYPLIFHTDNGNEFTARLIIDMIADINPAILTVTGCPRTPRDQVECVSLISMYEVD